MRSLVGIGRNVALAASTLVVLLGACSGSGSGGPDGASAQDQWAESSEPEPDVLADTVADVTDAGQTWEAVLTLPPYPYWDNQGFLVNEEMLQILADQYCQDSHEHPSAPEFFYYRLPMGSVAALCGAADQQQQVQTLLGFMYLSGFYGGVWFRDNADFGMDMPSGEEGPQPGPVTQEQFDPIAANAASLYAIATASTAPDVFTHNLEALKGTGTFMDALMTSLLTIFAYNYGYVHAILKNPPEGVTDVPSFPCSDYLACKLKTSPISSYYTYEAALDRLEALDNERWVELEAEVTKSRTWVNIGKDLWSGGEIDADAWQILVLINAGYLKISAAAVLGSMLGYGDEDEPAGRCATLLESAADTWNQAYFLALRSDAEVGAIPQIECKQDRKEN